MTPPPKGCSSQVKNQWFRVRSSVNFKFQARESAWARVKFKFKACVSVMAWTRLGVRFRVRFRV